VPSQQYNTFACRNRVDERIKIAIHRLKLRYD